MKSKKKIIIFLGLIFIFIAGIILQNNKEDTKNALQGDEKEMEVYESPITYEEKDLIAVSACPTFYYMLDMIEKENDTGKIKTIKTETTAEGLGLLNRREVDLVISGRALRSTEPNFLSEKIGLGYDFIFSKEILVSEQEMEFIPFYTNLSADKIIESFAFISEKNLIKAEDVFENLNKGIVITFLEEEMKGELVHIIQENGERLRLSRLPRLYYSFNTKLEKLEFIKKIIKEN